MACPLGSRPAALLLVALVLPFPAACFGHPGQLEACTFTDPTGCEEPAGSNSTTEPAASSAGASTGDTSTTDATSSTGGTSSGDASGSGLTTTTAEATTAEATTIEATTGAEAICGNGVVEDFGPLPEECDDDNLDPEDGCGDTCAADLVIFVSSIRYKPGELESLYVADAICFNRADDAGFLDPLRFRAWLSDSTTDARDRLKPGRGRLVLTNGLVVADSWQALLAGELQNPIEVTEKMETYHGEVWTGTRPDGTAVPGSEHCVDWSLTSGTKTGYYGYSDRVTPEWTLATEWNPTPCIPELPIYCLAER